MQMQVSDIQQKPKKKDEDLDEGILQVFVFSTPCAKEESNPHLYNNK